MKRSHYCGKVTESDIGKEVSLCGWVDRWRDHGGVVFIDLRDREGIVQIVFDPAEYGDQGAQLMEEAGKLRQEFVVGVTGKVRTRPEGMTNEKIPTGKVEVLISQLQTLSPSEPLPFPLHEDSPSAGDTDESVRLTYRYLDLRRPQLQKNFKIRHDLLKATRDYFFANGFYEIETPILYKSTPEGARDYLVPSRLQHGKFYALPQSPQTLKQLCMISGFDRYFQIARCFRDEDLRADRQPEFTQVDLEMSFIDEEGVFALNEGWMKAVFQAVKGIDLPTPFERLSYQDAILNYGSDKPDLRNSLKLVDLSEQAKKTSFRVYQDVLSSGGVFKALCFEEKQALTRKELDALVDEVRPFGAKGVSWFRIKAPGDWQSPQAKFFSETLKGEVEQKLKYTNQAMLLAVCGPQKIVDQSLSHLRERYGEKFDYVSNEPYKFSWIYDFPLFEYSEEDERLYAAHHPFTSVNRGDLSTFLNSSDVNELKGLRARAYDLVGNGYEIGGGSIRIHDPKEQKAMFRNLQISEEQQKHQFGFFIEALRYGTPPHGGMAFGVDRLAMLLAGTEAIRDVIAFPKTQKATCLMSQAPSDVSSEQLKELGLKLRS